MKKITILLMGLLLISGCLDTDNPQKIEQTRTLMSTFFTITVYDKDAAKAEIAINESFKEIERIENVLSIYKNDSEAYLLNKNGKIDDASDDLLYVMNRSIEYGDLSDGAFDITVQPILDLYTYTFTDLKRPPTDAEINKVSKLIGYKNIVIKDRHIEFKKPGMKITLGGIAKGYAVDKVVELLEERGVRHALVNAGGNMRSLGDKGSEDWQIALENPRNKAEYITVIPLNNNAVSTSGDYERYFDENKTFHHIVNPKTGYSAIELISVTVITPKAIDCDALSTSVFVLGKEKGIELMENLSVEGLVITREKEIIKSKGFNY